MSVLTAHPCIGVQDEIDFDFEEDLPPVALRPADDGRRRPDGNKGVVCRYWLKDRCMNGDNCKFLHQVSGAVCAVPDRVASDGARSRALTAMPCPRADGGVEDAAVSLRLVVQNQRLRVPPRG
jgi:hypothetical protein